MELKKNERNFKKEKHETSVHRYYVLRPLESANGYFTELKGTRDECLERYSSLVAAGYKAIFRDVEYVEIVNDIAFL